MSSENRRTLGTILIWAGVLAWAPFLAAIAAKQTVSIGPFLIAHLSGVLGGWWLRRSADRAAGIDRVEETHGQRRKLASRILIYLGILAWAPYIYLDRIVGQDLEIGPFLAAHLTGVLSGVALRLSVAWTRRRA